MLEKIILEHCSDFNEILRKLGYYQIRVHDDLLTYEHKTNKSKIIIKEVDNDIKLNFENRLDESFLKSDWYLGNKDGICIEDIFTLIAKPDFKNFVDVSFAWESDKPEEVINDKKEETLLTKFRKFEHIDKLIKSHTSFIITEDEPNIFIIHDGNYNMNIQVQIEENNVCVYVFDEKGEELGSETLGNISFLDNTIFNFAIFYERIYQDIRKERFDKAMEHDNKFNNVIIHRGTDMELTDTQNKIKNICDKISEVLIYKNKMYGNSILEPKQIFYKGGYVDNILMRLDDKIGRIANTSGGNPIRVNDIVDIIGYLILLLIAKNVGYSELEKLKD